MQNFQFEVAISLSGDRRKGTSSGSISSRSLIRKAFHRGLGAGDRNTCLTPLSDFSNVARGQYLTGFPHASEGSSRHLSCDN